MCCRRWGQGALVGITPMTDNMINGGAPSVRATSTPPCGTTVEVLNTDAEGRLVILGAGSWPQAGTDAIVDLRHPDRCVHGRPRGPSQA